MLNSDNIFYITFILSFLGFVIGYLTTKAMLKYFIEKSIKKRRAEISKVK